MEIKNKKDNIDLKYVNKNVLLMKIGKYKIPAYSLFWLILWLVFQNFFIFYITLIMIGISIYLETNKLSFKHFIYIIKYIIQDKMLFVSKNFKIYEKLKKD